MYGFIDFLKLPPEHFRSFIYCQWYIIIIISKVSQKFYIINFGEKVWFANRPFFVICQLY